MGMRIWASMKYATHLPCLIKALELTDGDVLELGPGVFSTPYLHWYCHMKKRYLLTIESHPKWSWFCRQYYDEPSHDHLFYPDWDSAKKAISKPWDVALVDHSPSERRVKEIAILKDLVKYIVVHDAEPEKEREYHLSTIYPLFKYKYLFTEVKHNVVVLSNLVDLKDFTIYGR